MAVFRALSLALLAVVLVGCETMTHKQISELKRVQPNPRILLMPLDVELAELSAGGVAEPKADWTEAAVQHMKPALDKFRTDRGLRLQEYVVPETTGNRNSDEDISIQLEKLHGVVGKSIMMHQYMPVLQLPSKQGKFDWTLGPAVQALKRKYDADYALFIFIRDSYSSAGRVAAIFIAAMLGVAVPGGAQIGFASLVDLETGDVVWFSRLARGVGDLRTPEPAAETMKVLFTDFPT